jgi:hypothetical protein
MFGSCAFIVRVFLWNYGCLGNRCFSLQLHKRALTIRKNGLMRTQDKTNEYVVKYANGVKENVNETTYVFPVKLMMNLERMNFINYEGGD